MQMIKILLIFTLLPLSSLAAPSKSDDILGLWLSEEKDGVIKMTREGDLIIGHLVWILPANGEKVEDLLDIENPDDSLKKRPLLGIKLLKDFKFDDGRWEDGSIYDPKSGKTYSAKMNLENENTLKLRGYVGIPLFGRTSAWSRVDKFPK